MRERSDALLMFLLEGALPSKYRERLEVDLSRLKVEDLTDEQLDAFTARFWGEAFPNDPAAAAEARKALEVVPVADGLITLKSTSLRINGSPPASITVSPGERLRVTNIFGDSNEVVLMYAGQVLPSLDGQRMGTPQSNPAPSRDPSKKHWWIASIAVPIIVALIVVLSSLIVGDGSGAAEIAADQVAAILGNGVENAVPVPGSHQQPEADYWLLLAERHLTRRRFGAMLGRIALLPVRTG